MIEPVGACWEVLPEPQDDDFVPHFKDWREAINSAAQLLTEDAYDDDRMPYVTSVCCWQVVCRGCRTPIGQDTTHYPADEARVIDAYLDDDLCYECETAQALGSVSGRNGVLLSTGRARPVSRDPGPGQLALIEAVAA